MIFNKSNNGAEELKDLLGFIYKSSDFKNIVPFIKFANRDVIRVIGPDTFKKAEDHYKSNYFKVDPVQGHAEYSTLDQLVEMVQLPVAINAYRLFAPQNDLTHSSSGRSIIVTETEKPAFEWMIDKSNKSLLELANESVDLLLDFLDEHANDKLPDDSFVLPWKNSKEREVIKSIFVDLDQMEHEFSFGRSRRIYLAVAPYMIKVQENVILPAIGQQRYDSIKEKLVGETPLGDLEDIMVNIRPAIVYLGLAKAITALSVEILPDGIFSPLVTGTINGKSSASHGDRLSISAMLKQMGGNEIGMLHEKIRKLNATESGLTYEPISLTDHIDPNAKFVRV